MALFLDNYSLESTLEYMADPLVAAIKGLCVNAVQMPHAHGEITVGSLDQEMVVVVHEAISMTNPVEAIYGTFQQQKKGLPISGIGKYIGSRIAAGSYVIYCAREFYA